MVEDNIDHAFLAAQAFVDVSANIALHTVDNGEKCMAFLNRQAPWGDAPRPAFVLLDVNMPRMSDDEVLSLIRADPGLCCLLVIMLSTTAVGCDIAHLNKLGCSGHLVKPGNYGVLMTAIQQHCNDWLGWALSPSA